MAMRMGLIEQLPIGDYESKDKSRECVICMIEFCKGDRVRYLPCMHFFHAGCVDEWLVKSFNCPSCLEAADAALLVAFVTQ